MSFPISMGDTPRTDAACNATYAQGVAHIPLVGFMEELERELDACKKLMLETLADKNVRIAELQSEINCLRAALSNVDAIKNLDC